MIFSSFLWAHNPSFRSLFRLGAILVASAIVPVAALAQGPTGTRLPVEIERIAPVTIVEKGPGHLFVDFGWVVFAGLEVKVPHAQPGQKLTVSLGEAISGPQTVHRKPGGSVRFHCAEVGMVAGQETYRVPLTAADKRWMPDGIGPVMPFRYVEIEGAPTGLGKEAIQQLAVHYPFDDSAAHFKSSDAKLNAIWELCRHTIKATSFCGVFVDGDRERKPYEGDAYINQLGWFSCTTDTTLPRYTWEYLVTHPTWPTEYILVTPILAWDDYRYTGNPAGLKAFYSDLKAKTLLSLERPDGLLSTGTAAIPQEIQQAIHIAKIQDLVDWPLGERDHYEMKPVNTVVNAFHCQALRSMANIARVLGHADDAALFDAAASKATHSLNTVLLDPATGFYVDAEGSRHSSLHANFFPLAFGLVPPERKKQIVDYVSSREMACSVYGAQFFLEALFDNGRADRALALMTAAGDRSWSHMLDQGTTLTYEAWDGRYKPNQDWNHAWGAAPANLIPRKLMGIEPLEPGFAKVLIAPKPGTLPWAEMRVPTVRGSLFVRFENGPGFRLEIELPPQTTARIGLPTSAVDGPVKLQLDGKSVVGTAKGGTVFLDNLGPGKHRCSL
ncbi:MAG: alpha-L-rhamnosidase C-terminal domain-containing protein [Chthoniobacteraceae bacterium]